MNQALSTIPPSIRLEFDKLRRDSKIKKHPQGIYLFLSIFTGYFDGDKVTMPDIAKKVGVKPPSLWGLKSRVDTNLSVDWTKYDLDGLKAHYQDLKDVSNEVAPPSFVLVPGKDGDIIVEENTSSTKYIARKHKDIMNNALEVMDEIFNDKEGRWINKKETNDHNGLKTEVEWFPGARNSVKWMNLYGSYMDKVRQYARDWLDLFGTLEESVIMDELNNRKDVMELTIDFLQEKAPNLVPDYIRSLAGPAQTSHIGE